MLPLQDIAYYQVTNTPLVAPLEDTNQGGLAMVGVSRTFFIVGVTNHSKEKYMLNTIDMLEAIGSNASLRYASTAELTDVLKQAHASDALASAVASGDSTHLTREFGDRTMFVPQVIQAFFFPN